ncbi:DUF2194 domain-containing protein [Fodinibius salsisoli]|uniref:DUF2194 domain-containing protein n=1 Tax=Fodinibius salsisoli TaxID=2820877 RepID=A0ABT3PR11_9BACT|nr:DUF2194 domain-containing protein [Fodinibius salsisoli]MCW9708307.1 DUF2194 domain-containing protein [Fodinibius salsisoli]
MSNNSYSICLYLLLVFLVYGCSWGCSSQQTYERQNDEKPDPLALLIKHPGDSTSNQISSQVTHTLNYASIPYVSHDLTLPQKGVKIPSTVQIIYLTTDQVEQFSDQEVEDLVEFIAAGNQLAIMTPLYDHRFAYMMGLKKDSNDTLDTTAEGYKFHANIFPEYKNAVFNPSGTFLHNGFASNQFISQKNVIATASNDSTYPAILEREIGQGSSVFFNTQHVIEKGYRGLLFSTTLKALEGIPYRIANVSSIFLDDFPAPLYDTQMPPIDEEYGITHADFVKNVWWPEMQTLADEFEISYTAMLAFNYNAVVVPPFDFEEWESSTTWIDNEPINTSEWLARDVRDSRHELGFHGYNHFSLWLKDWRNQQYMQTALQAAKKRWKIDNLGKFPRTYVPPTNHIDSIGLFALTKTMPQIKYMSSLYIGDVEEGEDREFGWDPLAPSLFDYPRITSGFVNNDVSNFDQHSLYLYTGIWTHFLHPDDVFQVEQRDEDQFRSRNPLGLGWHSNDEHDYGLYEVFRERLVETKDHYPHIRYETALNSVPIVKRWLATESQYTFSDSTLQVLTYSTQPGLEKNEQKFWFAYVAQEHEASFMRSLVASGVEFASSPLWNGKLYQFTSVADSLSVPNLQQQADSAQITQALKDYRNYTHGVEELSQEANSGEWRDTRFQDATAALKRNPASTKLQEQVIDLAVEFERVDMAIGILEQRLLDQPQWNTEDIQRLLTYYGWEGQSQRAFTFLESLWAKYPKKSVLMLKDMMVDRYGLPSEEFQQQWTKRALALDPDNNVLLEKMVFLNQSTEQWPEQKKYLQQLIDLNPRSDTLYNYALGQSMAYINYRETLGWLQTFPEAAEDQLKPLADDIAYMYADNGELTRAILWARKSDEIPRVTELNWLLQQQRYYDFITKGDKYLKKEPENDSLRVYVGQQLVYENFRDQGFSRLYPLFKDGQTPEQTEKLVHTEIGYMDYGQKKQFYKTYPNFFSDSLATDLETTYRTNEGVKVGGTASIASDNFNNEVATLGLFTEWGKRPKTTHRLSLDDKIVSSDILGTNNINELYHLRYQYQRSYRQQTMQSMLAGGIYADEQQLRPDIEAGFWFTGDSSYTSTQLQFEPVFTNSGIQQNINKLTLSLYREDYWFRSKWLQTGLSLTANWYSDHVFRYEGLSRFYLNLPFSTNYSKLRPLIDVSFSDATTSYLSGVPYYTPDQLFVKGVGIDYSYKDALYNPDFSAGIELALKHGSRDGAFFSGSAHLSARINKFWELSLQGDLSTSSVYRYNKIGLGISYTLPKSLSAD